MPRKASNPEKKSTKKAKPTARQNAAERMATEPGSRKKGRVPESQKQRSQSRFPGETPLTGEDRPVDKPGHKKTGQRTAPAETRRRGKVG